jgi:hypothetical protein
MLQPLHLQRKNLGTHCTGGWVDSRAGLDSVEKRKIPISSQKLNT